MPAKWRPGPFCTEECDKGHHAHLCQLEGCGRAFSSKRSTAKYCSASHGVRAAQMKVQVVPCVHQGCPNMAMPGLADGYCQSHHRRAVEGKNMDAPLKGRPALGQTESESRQCVAEGCIEPRVSRGYCDYHARRLRQGKPLDKECNWWNCTGVAVADGMCAEHFAGRKHRRVGVIGCDIEGCERKQNARGLCNMHYLRWLQNGDPGTAELRRRPDGSGYIDPNNYVHIQRKGVSKLEHIWVMEEAIGEPVDTSKFEVHHKNGIRNDNRIENLELKPLAHGAGAHVVDLIEFAERHGLIEAYLRDGNCENFPTWAKKS